MSSMKLPPPPRDTYEVEVPIPPSTNNLFRTIPGGHRVKSSDYKQWIEATERTFARLVAPGVFPVEVWIKLVGKINRQRDLDNFAKPILDQLVATGCLPDDNLTRVDRVDVWYEPDDGPPLAVVTVCEPEESPQ